MTWTPELDAELRRIYAIPHAARKAIALRRIAESVGISTRRFHRRAASLGLARSKRRWTDAEVHNLRQFAGIKTPYQIARILDRTVESVHMQLYLLHLSGRVRGQGYGIYELADLLGVASHTLNSKLQRWPINRNVHGRFWESDVQLWLWEHLDDFDLRPMNQAWLKKMLKEVAA